MMAVETKSNGSIPAAPPLVANGTGAVRRKRPSSLMAVAQTLPSVETSLEEFIARANQTLVDAEKWAEQDARKSNDDIKQREADSLRMKVAEQQLREGDAREQSLRRQLDAVQGKLAEAEARVAVSGTSTGAMQAAEALVADLRIRLERSEGRVADAVAHVKELEAEVSKAKAETTMVVRTSAPAASSDFNDGVSAERVKLAEAKAAKAIAAAKAAAAGLTVSAADIAAIESGLVVTDMAPPKGTPWIAIAASFIGGLAIMFGVMKLAIRSDAAPAAQQQTAGAASEPVKPTVTPIDTKPTVTPIEAAPAQQQAATPAQPPAIPATVEVVTPAATAPTTPTAPAAPTTPPPAHVAAAPATHAATHAAAPAAHAAAPATHAATPAKGGLADPFASGPAAPAAPAKAPAKGSPKSGLADPFSN
jgi:hypothetical protein|nr:hypothetical protein [Kofleriaceae bacterium]